jgi:hypothetical protein
MGHGRFAILEQAGVQADSKHGAQSVHPERLHVPFMLCSLRADYGPHGRCFPGRFWGLRPEKNRNIMGMDLAMNRHRNHGNSVLPAPPCRLRWKLAYPRVGLSQMPSQARPNLFSGD